MKQHIPRIASAWIMIGFVFLLTGTAFPQMIDKKDTAIVTTQSGTTQYVKGITAGRARALVAVFFGLVSLITGWKAKALSSKVTGSGRSGAIVALSLGLISIILSALHLLASAGAVFGSGSGKAGNIVAIVLSLIGITLAWLALRQKKMGGSHSGF